MKVLNVLVKLCCSHGNMDEEFQKQCELIMESLGLLGWGETTPATVKVAFEKKKVEHSQNNHMVVVQHTRTVDLLGMEFLNLLVKSIFELDNKRKFMVQPFGSAGELKYHPYAIHYTCGELK